MKTFKNIAAIFWAFGGFLFIIQDDFTNGLLCLILAQLYILQ